MWNYSAITLITTVSMLLMPLKVDTTTYYPDVPAEIQVACEKNGAEYDICPEFLEAICFEESRYTADVIGGSCKGLMQINEPVHKERMEQLEITDIFDIDSNIHVGADILHELFTDYSSDAGTVLMLYHGEKNAIKRGKQGNYSNYAQRILDKSAELERNHGK